MVNNWYNITVLLHIYSKLQEVALYKIKAILRVMSVSFGKDLWLIKLLSDVVQSCMNASMVRISCRLWADCNANHRRVCDLTETHVIMLQRYCRQSIV